MLHGCQLLPDVLPLLGEAILVHHACSLLPHGRGLHPGAVAMESQGCLDQLHNVTCTRPSSKPELAWTAGPGMQGSISSSAAPARIWREHLMPRAVPQGCSSQLALAAAGTRFLDLFPNPRMRCWGGQRVKGQRAELTAQGQGGGNVQPSDISPNLSCFATCPLERKDLTAVRLLGGCAAFFLKFYDSFSSPPSPPRNPPAFF